jgi:hypothetical protein
MEQQDSPDPSPAVPTVSICIANYNYGRFLPDAIDSCLAQTYPHVEVVVVDDGSTDESQEVIASYGEQVIADFQSNRGQAAAARRALEIGSGTVVVFLDADDALDADVIERAVHVFAARPELARVQWRLRAADASLNVSDETVPPRSWVMPEGDLRHHVLTRRTYIWPNTSGNAYARWAIDAVLPHIDPATRYIDFMLAETTAVVGPIANLESTGGLYRRHGANTSSVQSDLTEAVRTRMANVVVGHDNVRRVAQTIGLDCPADPIVALDWAYMQYRLASWRLDPHGHPLGPEHQGRLALRGMYAVATQPWMRPEAKAKRMSWFALVAAAPRPMARDLIERVIHQQPVDPGLVSEGRAPGPLSRLWKR